MIKKPSDFYQSEKKYFRHGNILGKILKAALDLFEAQQTGLLYGTNHTRMRFLPVESWDRGIMDKFEGRGLKGLILKLFGRYIVTIKGLSPVFFFKPGSSREKIPNDGIIAYVFRTCSDYYKESIRVLIFHKIYRDLHELDKPYTYIPFYSYNGIEFVRPQIQVKANTAIIKHFQAKNFISIYVPDYGILVINTGDHDLFRHDTVRFVNEHELKQRLDSLIDIIETASLAYLGTLTGQKGSALLPDKERQLRKTALALVRKERELEKTQKALQDHEARYRDLYENAPIAYFSTDAEERITQCNRAATTLLGYDEKSLTGMKARDLFIGTAQAESGMKQITGRLADGLPVNDFQIQATHKDGCMIWVSLSVNIVRDINGSIIETGIILNDISKRKKLETQLIQAQKMDAMGTLSGGIAHDFNTIMFPIIGHAEMLLLDYPEDMAHQENIKEIINKAKQAKNLIGQILKFSKHKEHELQPIKIQHILNDVLRMVRSILPATITIDQQIDQKAGAVMADSIQVQQIIIHLMTYTFNAIEERGGSLNVSLSEIYRPADGFTNLSSTASSFVCLTVADTGMGTEKSSDDMVLGSLVPLDRKGRGTGLGLSVVYEIIKTYGGVVDVKNQGGKGTTVKVYLPVIPASGTAGVKGKIRNMQP